MSYEQLASYGRGSFNRSGYNSRAVKGASSASSPGLPQGANIKQGLDTIIETIRAPTRPTAIPIKNVKYVASYNWVNTENPTIVVPGSPAQWTVQALPFTLQPDNGTSIIDQNGARSPEHPMLPLFTAADAIHGKEAPVDWPNVDMITDRNGLRKLLRWLNLAPGKEVRDFRIDVELVGTKTVILNRWESRTHEPFNGRNFGIGFEQAMTRPAPGCPRSGHHRVITYDMHDLKMIVRFEVDACLPTTNAGGQAKTTKTGGISDTKRSLTQTENVSGVDDLLEAFGSLKLQSATTKESPTINVVHALIEVTSRSVNYVDQLDWNELYPQLVLSQTPAVRLGVHQRGTFTSLREWQVDGSADSSVPGLSAQRKETTVQIVRLAVVLKRVQQLAVTRGPGPAGSFSLICEGGVLRVYGRNDKKSCLPRDVMARFSGNKA
ncbi:hypothetical protein BGW80DRAFT_1317515 [Lactifluus volemus]|nr:hypothetical protein BGW80DRAFT_1317515 [Lactifluus volemus]